VDDVGAGPRAFSTPGDAGGGVRGLSNVGQGRHRDTGVRESGRRHLSGEGRFRPGTCPGRPRDRRYRVGGTIGNLRPGALREKAWARRSASSRGVPRRGGSPVRPRGSGESVGMGSVLGRILTGRGRGWRPKQDRELAATSDALPLTHIPGARGNILRERPEARLRRLAARRPKWPEARGHGGFARKPGGRACPQTGLAGSARPPARCPRPANGPEAEQNSRAPQGRAGTSWAAERTGRAGVRYDEYEKI